MIALYGYCGAAVCSKREESERDERCFLALRFGLLNSRVSARKMTRPRVLQIQARVLPVRRPKFMNLTGSL